MDIIKIINNGEKTTTEFKLSYNKLPSNLFETICAFLNRNGGYIFLGIDDKKGIIGVDRVAVSNLKSDFITCCNNSQKIFPTVYLEINELEINGKIILYTYVHESSEVHKTNNKIYDRNEDGDIDITNNTTLISNMYIRKRRTYIENTIYPFATIDDLQENLIEKVRKMATNRVSNHPWGSMNNIELLRSASLYDKDFQTGKEGLTLAAILLLGKDETIASVVPHYKTDCLLRTKDIDRYDDRDDVRTNLIDSYDRLTSFIAKHLDDKFYLEGDQRISVRDKIARELCVNMLIHREYSNPSVSRLIIDENKILAENANRPKTIGYIDINNFVPYPKNPIIAKFFKEIGLADELGSGIKKIAKYTNIYSGGNAMFKEGDVFSVEIPIKLKSTCVVIKTQETTQETTQQHKYVNMILEFCKIPRTNNEIREYIGLKERSHFHTKILKPMINSDLIKFTNPDNPHSKKQKYVTNNNVDKEAILCKK